MTAILGSSVPASAEKALRDAGYQTLRLPPHPHLPPPVNSHPDMLLFFSSDAIFCTETYLKVAQKELNEISARTFLPIRTVLREVGKAYPEDVLLNAAPVGGLLFCRPDATAAELVYHPDFKVIPVRQGYAKCSVVPVGTHALMTSDVSIATAAKTHGIDVLLLPPGNIHLEGYPYGFVGGCTSFAPYQNTDTIFFCGALSQYEKGDEMQSFCRRHGFRLVSLGESRPIDVGTIFLIESKR